MIINWVGEARLEGFLANVIIGVLELAPMLVFAIIAEKRKNKGS